MSVQTDMIDMLHRGLITFNEYYALVVAKPGILIWDRMMSDRPNEPFQLGFKGEIWSEHLNALLVPVPTPSMVYVIIVRLLDGSYNVLTDGTLTECDHMLMAASEVTMIMERLANGVQ